MTHAEAIDTGQRAATNFGKVFIVYRLPAWPPDVYGCRAEDKGFPPGTETFERLAPGGSAKAAPPPADGQPRLFFEDAGVPAEQTPTFDAAHEAVDLEEDAEPQNWEI